MAMQIGTKLAVVNLECAGILPRDEVMDPKLEQVCIQMYKAAWWREEPTINEYNGRIVQRGFIIEANEAAGENPWR